MLRAALYSPDKKQTWNQLKFFSSFSCPPTALYSPVIFPQKLSTSLLLFVFEHSVIAVLTC